uniref:Uncharacterized protein n=1 Tax=Nelumbo nucifera TaxID=4432 RepID=A0A822Y5T0_NELNU|nr:TPA_asm: hypothetical protein HUJ06_028004 [Nelumbo nucifera]
MAYINRDLHGGPSICGGIGREKVGLSTVNGSDDRRFWHRNGVLRDACGGRQPGLQSLLERHLQRLSDLSSSLLTFFLIGKLKRRSSLLMFTTISGICSIMCVVVGESRKELQVAVELVSFFSACTAFSVLLIYTLEFFPTCVRNSALLMVRRALVFSGIFSPVLVAAGRKDGFLSYGVFGLVIECCGLFVVCLTETRGGTLCDTMDDCKGEIR